MTSTTAAPANHLGVIPTVDDLASSPLEVRNADIFNPPGLTNFLGAVQVDRDLTAVRNVNFPPLAGTDIVTAKLFVEGQFLEGTGVPITFTWRPDRVIRTASYHDLRMTSTTVVPMGRTAAMVHLEIYNQGGDRDLEVHLHLASAVGRMEGSLVEPIPAGDLNDTFIDHARGALVFSSQATEAVSVQGSSPRADRVDHYGLWYDLHLPSGHRWETTFVIALGDDVDQAGAIFDAVAADPSGELLRTHKAWNDELAAVVTPGNDRYSGHLPLLVSDDEDLQRLYWNGILGVVMFKRETPASVLGRTYDTLTPRYWPTITFLWDYSLSSVVHALLDPVVMRTHISHWLATDIHTCMGTSWLTGEGVGMWYAVNDYAMTRLLHDYLRWTGDHDLLDEPVTTSRGEHHVIDELVAYATNYRFFTTDHGLADYGEIGNLLECVSSYVHEVASLNAANVFNLRTAATVLDRRGEVDQAVQLYAEADDLAARVQSLYVEGKGFFNARHPDGTMVPVRHCYDLLTVLYAMPDDLSTDQRREMVRYWNKELRTDRWLRALSNRDLDATFSVRADHQWNGAYVAWPSETALGLYRIGEGARAATWLRGLAHSANQGPFGQAHFVEQVIPAHDGGARKVSPELPYINDWACSGGGSWASMVIEGIFGVRAGLDGITATPDLSGWDGDARLVGLTHQGRTYDVDRDGIHEVAAEVPA